MTLIARTILLTVISFSTIASAGSRYSCCLKRANGETFKVKGIASTYYTGNINSLCVNRAIEEKAEICEEDKLPNAMNIDLVRKKLSGPVDLSKGECEFYPCKITLHVPNNTKMSASSNGPLQCSIRKIINSTHGTEAHTLTVTLGKLSYISKEMGSCGVVAVSPSGLEYLDLETNIDRSNVQEYLDRASKDN